MTLTQRDFDRIFWGFVIFSNGTLMLNMIEVLAIFHQESFWKVLNFLPIFFGLIFAVLASDKNFRNPLFKRILNVYAASKILQTLTFDNRVFTFGLCWLLVFGIVLPMYPRWIAFEYCSLSTGQCETGKDFVYYYGIDVLLGLIGSLVLCVTITSQAFLKIVYYKLKEKHAKVVNTFMWGCLLLGSYFTFVLNFVEV